MPARTRPRKAAPKKPSGRPKKKAAPKRAKRTRKVRPATRRQLTKVIAAISGWSFGKLSKEVGVPKSTLYDWARADDWNAAKEAARKLSDDEAPVVAATGLAFQRLALSEKQKAVEDASLKPALLVLSISTQKLIGQLAETKGGGDIDSTDYKRFIDAAEKAMRMARVSVGLPERGRDYAMHDLVGLLHAFLEIVFEHVIRPHVPEPDTLRRISAEIRRTDFPRLLEEKRKGGGGEGV